MYEVASAKLFAVEILGGAVLSCESPSPDFQLSRMVPAVEDHHMALVLEGGGGGGMHIGWDEDVDNFATCDMGRKRAFNQVHDVDFSKLLDDRDVDASTLEREAQICCLPLYSSLSSNELYTPWSTNERNSVSRRCDEADHLVFPDELLIDTQPLLGSCFLEELDSEQLNYGPVDTASEHRGTALLDAAYDTLQHRLGLTEPVIPCCPSVKAVLVAKTLTRSDYQAKRVILPRIAVESNLSWVVNGPSDRLNVTDSKGKEWSFRLKSWSNGDNPKPVYVLEQMAGYLREYRLKTGDCVGLLATPDKRLWVENNTEDVQQAATRPTYSAFTLQQASSCQADMAGFAKTHGYVQMPYNKNWPEEAPEKAAGRLHVNGVLVCSRTVGCTRPAGHQGWCSGHKGYRKRAKARAESAETTRT